MSIIKDDPHAFDIISEGLGRDLKLLVAEGLQIAPVGWVVSEGNADDRTITCFGLFGIQQGVSAQGDDCVLPPMPVGCSKVVEGVGPPFSVVADKFVQVRVVPELNLQRPLSAGTFGHLSFIGVPHVEGSGQSHPLSIWIFDREADEPAAIVQRSGPEMFRCSLNPVF